MSPVVLLGPWHFRGFFGVLLCQVAFRLTQTGLLLVVALLKTALIFLFVSVLILRLRWRLPSMQLIMLGPLVGVSYGWRVILLMWLPLFVIGLVRFLGVGVRLEIGV